MMVVASIRLLIHVHASLYPRRVIRFGVDRRARPRASQPASQPATRKRVRIGTRLISTKIIKWRPSPPGSAVLNFAPILLSPPTQPAFSVVPFSSPPRPSSSLFFLCFFSLARSPTPPTSSFAFRKRHNSRDDAKGSRRTEANEFFYATIPTNRNRGHRCVVTVEMDSRIRRRMIVAYNATAYLNRGLALCRCLCRFARVSTVFDEFQCCTLANTDFPRVFNRAALDDPSTNQLRPTNKEETYSLS